VNQQLRFFQSRPKELLSGVAHWEGFIQPRSKESEVGGVCGGGGVKIGSEQ